MQFDIASSLVDIQSYRLSHHKQIQAKLDILRTYQPHSCVRKQALGFLVQNRGKIVDDECNRILSETELLYSLICNYFSATEYLPLTFDQERLAGGNDFVHIFALAKMMHEQFCQLAAALGENGIDLSLEALESHLESFDVLLETYYAPLHKPVVSAALPKMHKTLQYRAESAIPVKPPRCVSGQLLAYLSNRRAKSQASGGFLASRSLSSSPRRPFLQSQAAAALHDEYSECEERTRRFRRSVLRGQCEAGGAGEVGSAGRADSADKAGSANTTAKVYKTGQRYSRATFIKQNQGYTLQGREQAHSAREYPFAAHQRFRNYPQPPAPAETPMHACERAVALQRECGVDFDAQYVRGCQQYESALARLPQARDATFLAEQSVLLAQSRWVLQYNECRELKFLAAAIYYHNAEEYEARHADDAFQRDFSAWAQQVISQAEHAPIPDDYIAIQSIYQRRTSYTSVSSGKAHAVHPEVAAVRKWIDSQWDSHINTRRSRPDAELFDALAKLARTAYYTAHKAIGTVLLDQLSLDGAAEAAEYAEKALATRTP